ncbi:ROK family protein [Nonomuraea sp. NPDC049152]|uniref:ROK family protein n=1 Tax=Nonomuraea sp. NPDC049152 TaxID=3154350 RepID=UPI00340B4D0F
MRHVGFDLGGTLLRGLAESDGVREAVATHEVPRSYDALLDLIAELAGRADAVGIGLPGTSAGGTPVFVPALPWLEGRPLAADLEARLGAPVRLGLDGHLTLLAESVEGAAKGRRSAVLVAVGTGIGGALLVDGRIWRGAHGSAGSWGWLPDGTDPAADGTARGGSSGPGGGSAHGGSSGPGGRSAHGGFERAASGSALGGRGPELVAAARAGRVPAELDAYAVRLARGIAALASTLDPEVVLVGGGMADAMDVLGPMLAVHIERLASPDGRRVPVIAAGLGSSAGVVGALLAARIGVDW